jgi:hypothetical protein
MAAVIGAPPEPKAPGMPGDSRDASLRSRIAANERWAHTDDRAAATAPARAGLDARFVAEVDPDGMLDPAERARRVASKRRAYFARLALLSAQSRRRAAEERHEVANRRVAGDARRAAGELRKAADDIEAAAEAAG